MKFGRLALITILMLTSARARCLAAVELRRPVFSATDSAFAVAPREPAIRLTNESSPVQVYVFERAVQTCSLNVEEVTEQIQDLVQANSQIWTVLDHLFSDSYRQVQRRDLKVVIDDFSSFAGASPTFGSYFMRKPYQVIGLDCAPIVRQSWKFLLTHELTHLLLAKQNVESWWEEGLAQLMEREAGGSQPELTLQALENLPADQPLPILFEQARPVVRHETYAITYLFARYVRDMFDGWATLRAMTGLDSASSARSVFGRDYLEQMITRATSSVGASGTDMKLPQDKFSREGILTFFYAALAMHDGIAPRYQISGWDGFANLPGGPNGNSLAPGQAALFVHQSTLLRNIHTGLETYRILQADDGNFEVLSAAQGSAAPSERLPFSPASDIDLVLNLGFERLPLSQ